MPTHVIASSDNLQQSLHFLQQQDQPIKFLHFPPRLSNMLFYVIFATGVVSGVYGNILSPQSGLDSEPDLVWEEALPPRIKEPVFDEASEVLNRRKREWYIPPISISENHRGPFPMKLLEVRSKKKGVAFSITGSGADQPPIGLFTIDQDTGSIYVTQSFDRELQASYLLVVHATTTEGVPADDPLELHIKVIDMNDNKPVFQKDVFLGQVNETSPLGFEFMKVVATDADEPDNANSDIRYRILSQDPPMSNTTFFINPFTGGISVNATLPDREKCSNYTLEIQAADMDGEGFAAYSKAIITVTDSDSPVPLVPLSLD